MTGCLLSYRALYVVANKHICLYSELFFVNFFQHVIFEANLGTKSIDRFSSTYKETLSFLKTQVSLITASINSLREPHAIYHL